jgi:chemotaxis protein methyltransferase CheR
MTARALSERQLDAIAELVRARTGLTFARTRRQQAETGIRQAMAEGGASDPDQFCHVVRSDERAFQALVENLTVAETYFFRERDQFQVLRQRILPELARGMRAGERLRLWSAGCASGEEAYSLAILLEQEGLADRACVIATDISRAALTLARKASYGAWSFRDSTPDIAGAYFRRQGNRLALIDRIRRMVEFDLLNLAEPIYPLRVTGPLGLDVILCRNVLIYFDAETVERVAKQMFDSLKDGGWLITGPSDPPLWNYAPYETVLTAGGVLYRRNGGIAEGRRRRGPDRLFASGAIASHDPVPVAAAARPSAAAAAARKEAPSRWTDQSHERANGSPEAPPAPDACAAELKQIAQRGDPRETASALIAAAETHPLSPELHYLQAIVLMSLGRYDEATSSLRRVIYLDRSMAAAHFTLGSIQQRRGAFAEARRSYRNVLAACGRRDADEVIPLSEGETVGRLANAARAQLAHIEHHAGRGS